MGIIKFNKTEKDNKKEATIQAKWSDIVAEQAETVQTTVKAEEKLQNNNMFCDDGFVEEILSDKGTNVTCYRRNDRTKRKIISASPLHYLNESNGKYETVDNTLTDNGNVIENSANSFKVSFDKSLSGGKIFDLKKGDKAVSLYSADFSKKEKHTGGCSCELCSEGNSVTFKSSDGTELQYKVLSDRVKENIIVNGRQDSYEYLFVMDIGNMLVEEDNGSILLKDSITGETQFIIPSPYMFDANNVCSNEVTYEVVAESDQLLIKVIADSDFINAADRAFPVVIDPQIVLYGKGSGITFESIIEYDNGEIERCPEMIEVYDSSRSGRCCEAYVRFNLPTIDVIITKATLVLFCGEGCGVINVGGQHFYPNNDEYQEIEVDVTNNKSGLINLTPIGQTYSYALFEIVGEMAPRLVIDYIEVRNPYEDKEYEGEVVPLIKEFDFTDRAKGHLYANSGALATSFKSFEDSDFVLPLNITHIHKLGLGATNYGLNWRLNLNRKLNVASDDTAQTTRYIYTDEFGDKYIFNEKYYYLNGTSKIFISKHVVTADINGGLTYLNKPVYTYQSCNGFTLIPEINDFKNSELIEQRQDERIQLEEFVNQYEPKLKNYVRAYSDNGTINAYLNSLTKSDYDSLVSIITQTSNYILISKNEALQLKALYLDVAELENQIDQLDERINDKATEGYAEASTYSTLLETQKTNKTNQKDLINSQISNIIKQAKENLPLIKETFIKYFAKKAQLDLLLLQTPVNYLKDVNGVISGFNSNGDLVLLSDSYGNYVNIIYNADNQITEIYDSNNKTMNFEYSNGLLQSITDNRGRVVKYFYNSNKLQTVTFADDITLTFKYASNLMRSIETGNGIQAKLTFDEFKRLTAIDNASQPLTIGDTVTSASTSFSKTLQELTFSYTKNTISITDNENNFKKLTFDDNNERVIAVEEKDNLNNSTVTNYSYNNTNGKQITAVTKKNDDDPVTTVKQYNNIDLLVSEYIDWQKISDTVRVKTETVYTYDLNNQLTSKTVNKFTEVDGESQTETNRTNYRYNAAGNLVLTESYIDGEELSSGKFYEEKVYDDKGQVIKTISWNSLDSSSKFYTESVVADNGQLTDEKDETGEIIAEYEYLSGTNIVNSVKYPNGSKFAYGIDSNSFEVTSLTQSTDDGEANTTDIIYNFGLPVKVKSANTVIDYVYDHKGRKVKFDINGVTLSTFGYKDYSYNKETLSSVYSGQTQTLADGTVVAFNKTGITDEATGRIRTTEEFKIGSTVMCSKNYGYDGLLNTVTDSIAGTSTYIYDAYNNVTQIQRVKNTIAVLTENFVYNGYGELTGKEITGSVSHAYSFCYKANAAHDLDYVLFGSYKFKPLSDVNGRNTGKEIFNGENKVAAEYISYRKIGDHATNMPAIVWFGDSANIKDSVKYKYDRSGNICEVTENGHLAAKYSYDSLNRLVREDNKLIGKTVLYNYDSNGNITERCEYDYTANTTEDLSELNCYHFDYEYNGDKLISYNGEKCAYNAIGNPTVYRGKTVTWQYGKYLLTFNGISFTYNGNGTRASKGNVIFTYDSYGRLIKQSNGLEFIYDFSGVTGVIYNGEQYFYRKDVQGNIIAILDNTGSVVVKYVYDAWGNHAVVDNNGEDITEGIGILNPFRYRGYYYDIETDLYYLQTRYYDPETGRFISQDSIEYADPETINGLNLYAYCYDNPVTYFDPNGNFAISLAIALLISLGAVAVIATLEATAHPIQKAIDNLSDAIGDLINDLKQDNYIDVIGTDNIDSENIIDITNIDLNLQLLDFFSSNIRFFNEHGKNQRPSNLPRHQKGQRRRGKDTPGGEKGDRKRPYRRGGKHTKHSLIMLNLFPIIIL